MIDNIQDNEIKEKLQKMKTTSLHQLSKCKNMLYNKVKEYIGSDQKKNINEFIWTLDLLSLSGEEKNNILGLQKTYFGKYLETMEYVAQFDQGKMMLLQVLRRAAMSQDFNPAKLIEITELIKNTQ